ncbi:MAG: DUF1376 domain-containing protein [Planctomycetaceae bacterium]
MAKAPPSFNLYPGDLIKSCVDMSAAEFGAYMRLLCYQWEHGAIPGQTDKLARICGMDRAEFLIAWSSIKDRFTDLDGGNLKVQSRLSQQRQKDIEVWEARRIGGRKGGRPSSRDEKTRENEKPQGLGGGSVSETSTEKGEGKREKPNSKEKEAPNASDDRWLVPEPLDCPEVRGLLGEFEAMRKRKGKPVRSLATTSKVLRHFDNREHLIYALETCIANEYQGLKADYRPPVSKSGQQRLTFAQQSLENSKNAIKEFCGG